MDKEALTLRDYLDELNWVRQMGWSDQDLGQVRVYEQLPAGKSFINLANFGGTALGVLEQDGGTTSANVRAIRNMYVVQDETPPHLWAQLKALADRGGPSGFEESGEFGEVGEATDFPPR